MSGKDIIIAILLVWVISSTITFFTTPSIREQAEILSENGYEIDCNAIDKFLVAWDNYLKTETEYNGYIEENRNKSTPRF